MLAAVGSKVPSAFFAELCLSKLEAFEKEFVVPAKDPSSSFGGGLGNTKFNFFHRIKNVSPLFVVMLDPSEYKLNVSFDTTHEELLLLLHTQILRALRSA